MVIAKIKLFSQKVFQRKILQNGKTYKFTWSGSGVKLKVLTFKDGKWDSGVIVKSGDNFTVDKKTKNINIVFQSPGKISNIAIVKQ